MRSNAVTLVLMALCLAAPSWAETYTADSSNYRNRLSQLGPGDTLLLAPGIYNDPNTTPGLPFFNVHGETGAPIVISGSDSTDRPVFHGRSTHNTVRFDDASHITIRHI
ncbi:MAG: hypothetical protein GF331_18395, partial [Chitinivibrionales bacterium]|nr:hypothetical protein [Chitinivibrionales bacterium]